MNDSPENQRERLEQLRVEHRDLDDIIRRLNEDSAPNVIQIQRLKKRKLVLKDLISRLESSSIPDIIA